MCIDWASERGTAAAEYVGVGVVIAAVIGALFSFTPSPLDHLRSPVDDQVCNVLGQPCSGADLPGDQPAAEGLTLSPSDMPDACVLLTTDRSFGGTVKVTFIEVGKREGYVMEHRSDGEIHVTWVAEGTGGLTAGIGADGGIVLPTGDVKGGASLSGQVHVGANAGQTWVFTDEAEADAFVRSRRDHAIRENVEHVVPITRIVTGVNDLLRGGSSFPDPDLVYFDAVLGASGSAGVSLGPAAGGGEASGEIVAGGVHDRRTGEATLLVKMEGEVAGEGGLLVGASGSEGASRVVALTLDADGQPVTLATTRSDVSGRGGLIGGQALTLDDVGDVFGTMTGGFDAEGTHTLTLTTELDLRDPANRETAMDLFTAVASAGLPGGPGRMQEAADDYAERVAAGGRVSVTEHEGETWGLGAGAQVALAAKLGFDLGYAASDSRLASALYLGDPVGGVRTLVPWTACTG